MPGSEVSEKANGYMKCSLKACLCHCSVLVCLSVPLQCFGMSLCATAVFWCVSFSFIRQHSGSHFHTNPIHFFCAKNVCFYGGIMYF